MLEVLSRPGLGCPGLHRHRHDLDLCLLPFRVPGTFSSKKDHVRAQVLLPAPLRPWFLPVLESATSLRQAFALRVHASLLQCALFQESSAGLQASPRPQSRLEPPRAGENSGRALLLSVGFCESLLESRAFLTCC